jgi:DNA-binding PucR family transcriptional regulator
MPAGKSEAWLDLLLTGASLDSISRHGDELVRAGVEPADAERQATAAVQLNALLDERRRRIAELTALNDIAAQLTSTHAVDQLLPLITTQTRRLLGVDLAYIGVVHGEDFVIEVASGALTTQLVGMHVPRGAGMLSLVIGRGEPVWTSDYAAETSFAHELFDDMVAAEHFRALLGVPLTLAGRAVGALFACKRAERHFHDDEVSLLAALASHAAIAIEIANALKRHRQAAERLNAANRALEQTLAWDRQLTNVVLGGGSVEDLVSEVAAGATGHLVVLSADAVLPEDVAAQCPELITKFEAMKAERAWGDRVMEADGETAQLAPIVAGGEMLGALVLVDGSDRNSDRLLLERAAPAVALAMTGERAVAEATRLTRDAMVLDLLTRAPTNPATSRQRVHNAGLDPAAAYCIIAAQPSDELPRGHWTRVVADLPGGSTIVADGTRVVAVIPTENPNAAKQQWNARTGGTATAGVAGPAAGPADLHRCYREAADTMQALLTLGRTGTSATAEQLGIYRILLTQAGRRELRAQFDEILGAVVAEQKHRNVPMLATLKEFLDHGCRAAPTARALDIHVNTLYQRIALLDRLLGPDWRQPPRSLDLHVLLRVFPDPNPT